MLPNPLPECQFHYPDGRHCRRIPKRDDVYCADHRRALRAHATPRRRALPAPQPVVPAAFARGLGSAKSHPSRERALPPLAGLSLDQMLFDIAASLHALEPLVRGHASDREVRRYQRACAAMGCAMDRVAGLPQTLADAFPNLGPDRLRLLCIGLMYAAPHPQTP